MTNNCFVPSDGNTWSGNIWNVDWWKWICTYFYGCRCLVLNWLLSGKAIDLERDSHASAQDFCYYTGLLCIVCNGDTWSMSWSWLSAYDAGQKLTWNAGKHSYLHCFNSPIVHYFADLLTDIKFHHIITIRNSSCAKVFTGVLSVHRGGRCTLPWEDTPHWADTPPMATGAEGTHPIGMHSCFNVKAVLCTCICIFINLR